MAMAAKDIKPGMGVTGVAGGLEWEVLDKHPQPAHWWLHRRNEEGTWQSTYAHQNQLTYVGEGSRRETVG